MKGKTMNTPRDLAMGLVDTGSATERQMLQACLAYMSWDEVSDMLKTNEFLDILPDGYAEEHFQVNPSPYCMANKTS